MSANFHAVWCSQRECGETHDDTMPYCYKQIHGVKLLAPDGAVPPQLWVYATATAHPDALTSGERAADGHLHDSIELITEYRVDTEWVEHKLRISDDAARSLAATLIRAADIKQGLTR